MHRAVLTRPKDDRQACFYATPCGHGCSIGAAFQTTTSLIPMAKAISAFIDFGVVIIIMFLCMLIYQFPPSGNIIYFPFFINIKTVYRHISIIIG